MVKQGYNVFAFVLLGITLLAMVTPGGQFFLPSRYNKIYTKIQVVIWISLLFFSSPMHGEKKISGIK